MKYALLVYDAPESWDSLSSEEKHALHAAYHALATSPAIISHYRLRPPRLTTTVRVEDGQIASRESPLAETRETLRALYLLESNNKDIVLELAARIPAAGRGGAVEVWPLTGK